MYQGIIGVERGFTAPKGPPQKDFGTGLIYFNARYYDPELGIFISPDTIVPDAGNLFAYNRYMYVAGNPLRLTDSSGHVWETVVDAVSVGYGIYDIYQNGLNWENGTSLAVDVVHMFLVGDRPWLVQVRPICSVNKKGVVQPLHNSLFYPSPFAPYCGCGGNAAINSSHVAASIAGLTRVLS